MRRRRYRAAGGPGRRRPRARRAGPRRAHALHQRADPHQRGLRARARAPRRRGAGRRAGGAARRAPRGRSPRRRRSAARARSGSSGHGALGGRGLDEHDRDVVGDDIVQLARDPRALGQDRRLLAFGAVALDLAGLLVETAIEGVARAQHPPSRAGMPTGTMHTQAMPVDRLLVSSPSSTEAAVSRPTVAIAPSARARVSARRPSTRIPTMQMKTAVSPASSRRPPSAASATHSAPKASRPASGARHGEGQRDGVSTAKTRVTARWPGSATSAASRSCARPNASASAVSARAGSRARPEHVRDGPAAHAADGRAAPAGCRRPQG